MPNHRIFTVQGDFTSVIPTIPNGLINTNSNIVAPRKKENPTTK